MKFDLMSDLHVDLSPSYVLDYAAMATSPIAVVAGDISNDPHTTILEIDRISCYYDKVIFVDGNHEHYDNRSESKNRGHRMPPETYQILRKAFEGNDKVFYLDQGRNACIIDDVAFIGANNWYDFNWGNINSDHCISTWYQEMNDSYWANIDHEWVMNEAIKHNSNIMATVASLNQNNKVRKIVLVTHTVPHTNGIYNGHNHKWILLNGCYLNSKAHEAGFGKVVAHCFGHTHKRQMFTVDNVEYICNPRGYQGEPQFENWSPIQIDLGFSGSVFGEIEP